MRSVWTVLFAGLSLVVAAGCGTPDYGGTQRYVHGSSTSDTDPQPTAGAQPQADGDTGEDDGPLGSSADEGKPGNPAMGQGLAAGSTAAEATENLNLRDAPSIDANVLAIIPGGSAVDLVSSTASNGYLNVTFNGITGWAHSAYLVSIVNSNQDGTPAPPGSPSPDNAVARAESAVGFSYNWGAGAWLESGPTSSTRGYCAGTCPSCSHHGTYGADCSGLVAKAWQFGDNDLAVNSHPYNTGDFIHDSSGQWSTVSRNSMAKADALVYRDGSHGHIALYEKGDAWGTPTVFECRSCGYGCVHDTRSFSSVYHGIRRDGF